MQVTLTIAEQLDSIFL